eukprot:scaffold79385_cov64-Phaeocystis_antarctica.AAC.5
MSARRRAGRVLVDAGDVVLKVGVDGEGRLDRAWQSRARGAHDQPPQPGRVRRRSKRAGRSAGRCRGAVS